MARRAERAEHAYVAGSGGLVADLAAALITALRERDAEAAATLIKMIEARDPLWGSLLRAAV